MAQRLHMTLTAGGNTSNVIKTPPTAVVQTPVVTEKHHPKLGKIPTGSIEAQPGSRGESSNPNGGNDDEYFN